MARHIPLSRRKFIVASAKSSIAVAIGITGVPGSLLNSCSASNINKHPAWPIGFDQQPLPYQYNALEDIIDARTMEIHYSKHAAGYSKSLKEAASAEGVNMNEPIEKILGNISKYSVKMRNNAGGHYNHELFWQCMRPKITDNKPDGNLLQKIGAGFGSFDNFKTQFSEVAKNRFGSGWAWLYADAQKNLTIGSTPNQDNPLMDISDIKGFPLLGLDVWEHAYYLKYQNKRADYISNWWNVVNWNFVQQRFSAMKIQ